MKNTVYLLVLLSLVFAAGSVLKIDRVQDVPNFFGNTLLGDNFYEVAKGRLYRSAEMAPKNLEGKIKDLGIKSVIDLRLSPENEIVDGRTEEEVVKALGAKYFSVPMRSTHVPAQDLLNRLVESIKTAEEPVLIHCLDGVHRAAVASALWLHLRDNLPMKEAAKQLSSEYGYFQIAQDVKEWRVGHQTVDDLVWNFAKANAGDLFSWAKSALPESDRFSGELKELEARSPVHAP